MPRRALPRTEGHDWLQQAGATRPAPRDVLRYEAFLIFPIIDGRASDGGLQAAAMMVFRIPGAGRLMIAAKPNHGIGYDFIAQLQSLKIVFFGGNEILVENAESIPRESENSIDVKPGVVVFLVRLTGSCERLDGDENLEFIGGMIVLCDSLICRQCA